MLLSESDKPTALLESILPCYGLDVCYQSTITGYRVSAENSVLSIVYPSPPNGSETYVRKREITDSGQLGDHSWPKGTPAKTLLYWPAGRPAFDRDNPVPPDEVVLLEGESSVIALQAWADTANKGSSILAVGTTGPWLPSEGWWLDQLISVLDSGAVLSVWPDTTPEGALDSGGRKWLPAVAAVLGDRINRVLGGGFPGLDARDVACRGRLSAVMSNPDAAGDVLSLLSTVQPSVQQQPKNKPVAAHTLHTRSKGLTDITGELRTEALRAYPRLLHTKGARLGQAHAGRTSGETLWHCYNPAGHNQGDRKPSLSANLDDGVHHCFSCNESGDAFSLMAEVDYQNNLKEMYADYRRRNNLTGSYRSAPNQPPAAAAEGKDDVCWDDSDPESDGWPVCYRRECDHRYQPSANKMRSYCQCHDKAGLQKAAQENEERIRALAESAWKEVDEHFDRLVYLGSDKEGGHGWQQTNKKDGWKPVSVSAIAERLERTRLGRENPGELAELLTPKMMRVAEAQHAPEGINDVLSPSAVKYGYPVHIHTGKTLPHTEPWGNTNALSYDPESGDLTVSKLDPNWWTTRPAIPWELPVTSSRKQVLSQLESWSSGQKTPLWDRLVDQIPPEERRLLLSLIGRGLLYQDHPHALIALTGSGGTGKSTLGRVIASVVGHYATGDVSQLSHRFSIAAIAHGRVLLLQDLPPLDHRKPGHAHVESMLKKLAAGDEMQSERKYSSDPTMVSLRPLIVTTGNYPPGYASGVEDRAAWERRLYHFTMDTQPEEQDPRLADSLIKLEGRILAVQAVCSYIRWRHRGCPVPESMAARRRELILSSLPPLSRWMTETVFPDLGCMVTTTDIRDRYTSEGNSVTSPQSFAKAVTKILEGMGVKRLFKRRVPGSSGGAVLHWAARLRPADDAEDAYETAGGSTADSTAPAVEEEKWVHESLDGAF